MNRILVLLRHGQSEWNLKNLFTGWKDPNLTDIGVEEARAAGLLHDLGKYSDLFTLRLEGKEKGLDHWSPGAWVALMRYRALGLATALAIQGHHIGLQKGDKTSLGELNPVRLQQRHPLGLRLTDPDSDRLRRRLEADGLALPHSETASKLPTSPYGVAKLSAEHYLAAFGLSAGLQAVSLRYSNVYGPRQDPEGEGGVVAVQQAGLGRELMGEPQAQPDLLDAEPQHALPSEGQDYVAFVEPGNVITRRAGMPGQSGDEFGEPPPRMPQMPGGGPRNLLL